MFKLIVLYFSLIPPTNSPSEVMTLAKLCVAEANWDTNTEDCRVILRVLQNRPYRSITRAARLYNGRALGRLSPGNARNVWVSSLDKDPPKGFPGGPRAWNAYRTKWRMRLLDARILLRSTGGPAPCTYRGLTTEPIHWGGAMDARPAGMVRLDCGYTLNRFYGVKK